MKKIIECIPNFSEGKDQKKIDQILKEITDTPGVFLLDYESDPAHNRSVVTFAGEPKAVLEAAFKSIKKASELIDLNKHKGEHPRMGATDVCPLVPIKGVKSAECIEYAEKLGERVGKELKIPVYLYEDAAKKPERQNLADVRRGQYEGIKKEIGKDPKRKPDFGPTKLGSAGAVAIGARPPLVAYNVNLA
ncbi:MAG: glutamate formimidoyltransferase, partial [bacterium]|nr:glutamate formimidoyltransferase [bacterium]